MVSISAAPSTVQAVHGGYLLEKTWAKVVGSGDEGESVYGLKEDFRPLVVGDGMSWVAVAITVYACPLVLVVHGEAGPWGEPLVGPSRSPKRPLGAQGAVEGEALAQG